MTTQYELTEAQKQIWYIEQMYPGTPVHNIGGSVRIKGGLCFYRLKGAFQFLISRHRGLRIEISTRGGEPFQYVASEREVNFDYFDFSLYSGEAERNLQEWIDEEASTPFQLCGKPLFRIAFFRLSDHEGGFLIKAHHIIADLWSMGLVTRQIEVLYNQASPPPSDFYSDYFDYLLQEKSYLNSPRCARDKDFWFNTFASCKCIAQDKKYTNLKSRRLTFTLDRELTQTIKGSIDAMGGLSLGGIFYALVGIHGYLKKGITEQVVAIPVFNRHTSTEKRTVGMCMNTLPFFLRIDPSHSISDFFRRIKREFHRLLVHHRYPYHSLIQELKNEGVDISTIATTSVNYYNTLHPRTFGGFEVIYTDFFSGYQIYPVHIIIHEWTQGAIQFYIEYQTDSYEEATIRQLAKDYINLLRMISGNPNYKIEQLSLLSHIPPSFESFPYRTLLSSFSEPQQTVIDCFEERVNAHPGRIAVQQGNETWTYGELKGRIDDCASFLEPRLNGTIIAIIGSPSIEALISIFAVLRLGCCYLPLNPHESAVRIAYILRETNAKILMYWDTLPDSFASFVGEKVDVRQAGEHKRAIFDRTSQIGDLNRLAYLIYTSGSTGKPKGVKITHKNLLAYLEWAKMYVDHPGSVFSFYSSLAFDLTVTSIFLPLITGGKIKIFQENSQYVLQAILEDEEVTVLKATPSHLALVKDTTYPKSALCNLIIGGEDLKVELAARIQRNFGRRLRIYNEYGPTEATVGCMLHEFNDAIDIAGSVPIGSAQGQTSLCVLDEKGKSVRVGEIGELYIGGPQVADGYWHSEGSTSPHFVHLPYAATPFYKTGDLVSQTDQEVLVFKGRIDDEIKIHGYRVDLAEIESLLSRFPGVKHTCVATVLYSDGIKIAAFFLCEGVVDIPALNLYLSSHLAFYKVPTFLIQVDDIPCTINGKVDKARLLVQFDSFLNRTSLSHSQSDITQLVSDVICTTLNIETLDPDANYFQIGGDSIAAIRIASRLASLGIDLSVQRVMAAQTIQEILNGAKRAKGAKTAIASSGIQPWTATLRWFFKQQFKRPSFYHHSVLLKLNSYYRLDQLERALNQLVQMHDCLCLNYDFSKELLFYNLDLKEKEIKIARCDLRSSADPIAEKRRIEEIAFELKDRTDISTGHLLSVAAIFCSHGIQSLLICVHHLAVDGVSWDILLEDLDQILHTYRLKLPYSPPLSTTTFLAWVRMQEETPRLPYGREELEAYLSRMPTPLLGPVCRSREDAVSKFSISPELTERLCARSERVLKRPLGSLLTAACVITLGGLMSKNRVPLIIEHHGRTFSDSRVDLKRVVGWCTVMCPLYFDLHTDVWLTIRDVHAVLSLFHRHIDALAMDNRWLQEYPLPYRFNYLGTFHKKYREFELGEIGVGEDIHRENRRLDVDMNIIYIDRSLVCMLDVAPGLPFSSAQFIDLYCGTLEKIAHICPKEQDSCFVNDFDTISLTKDDDEELFQ